MSETQAFEAGEELQKYVHERRSVVLQAFFLRLSSSDPLTKFSDTYLLRVIEDAFQQAVLANQWIVKPMSHLFATVGQSLVNDSLLHFHSSRVDKLNRKRRITKSPGSTHSPVFATSPISRNNSKERT